MKRQSRDVIPGLLLSSMLVVALVLAVVTPITIPQRVASLSVIGAAVLWAAVLHWALSRTPEGRGRLGSSPPLALDMLSGVVLVGAAVLVDRSGPSGPGLISWSVGVAAGAVLMVPFSWTLRWLWWEWQHRRPGRPPAPSGPTDPEPDRRGDQRSGVAGPDVPPTA